MSSSTVHRLFSGFVMENAWKGLWEVMAENSFVGLETQPKKTV